MRRRLAFASMLLLAACGGGPGTPAPDRSNVAIELQPPAGPALGSEAPRDCFWTLASESNAANILYPDEAATYWVATLAIPPGGEVRLSGRFPRARYVSFNLYNPRLEPLDALADVEIVPEDGAANPFAAGARRDLPADYRVRIVSGLRPEDPAQRAPNTLYAFQALGGQAQPSPLAIVIYRVYVADAGQDRSGGAGLPAVELVSPAGTLRGEDACAALETNLPPGGTESLATLDTPIDVLPGTAAFRDLQWLKFFDLASSQANRFNATPLGAGFRTLVPAPSGNAGGFASNAHNNYIYSVFSQEHGAVGVFEAVFPVTPRTYGGATTMGAGEMRYWSLCTNDSNSQRYYDCRFDEEVTRDAAGRGVIVVSRPQDRPSNARHECGVSWLAWGPTAQSLLIYRHMLPQPDFPYAIQQVPGPPGTHETAVMQHFFPYGTHMDVAAFEALGCPVSPAAIPDRASQPAG